MKVIQSIKVHNHTVTFFKKTNGEPDFLIEGVEKTDSSWNSIFWYMVDEGLVEKYLGQNAMVKMLLKRQDTNLARIRALRKELESMEDYEDSND